MGPSHSRRVARRERDLTPITLDDRKMLCSIASERAVSDVRTAIEDPSDRATYERAEQTLELMGRVCNFDSDIRPSSTTILPYGKSWMDMHAGGYRP